MVLAAGPAFLLGMAWWTPLFRESAFVPLLLFSSLYAAVMLGTLWDGLGAVLPALRSPLVSAWASALAFCMVAALAVPPGWSYVRSRAVGSTIGDALAWLRQDRPSGGPPLVFVEEAAFGGSEDGVMELAEGTGLRVVPRLAAVGGDRLARADGEVFLRSELGGPDGGFYRARGEAGSGRRRVVTSSILWRHGPDLVAVRHPYGASARPVGVPLARRGGSRVGAVPAAPDAAFVSLVLRLPPTDVAAPRAPGVTLDGAGIALAPAGRSPEGVFFFSERLAAAPAPRRIEVQPPPWASDPAAGIEASVYLWP